MLPLTPFVVPGVVVFLVVEDVFVDDSEDGAHAFISCLDVSARSAAIRAA